MRELLYTILELEEWNQGGTCDFCSGLRNKNNKAVCQVRTRSKANEELVANDCACENCKEKFENDELPKCERCGRLQTKTYISILCRCIRNKENLEEKELPILPHEGSPYAFYERQINSLREELNTAEVEAQTHLDAMEAFEVYNKKHRQELLDKIKELEEQNKKLSSEELAQKVETYEKEIEELKKQLAQFTSQQQKAQVETPPKDKGFKGFFKFGGKK